MKSSSSLHLYTNVNQLCTKSDRFVCLFNMMPNYQTAINNIERSINFRFRFIDDVALNRRRVFPIILASYIQQNLKSMITSMSSTLTTHLDLYIHHHINGHLPSTHTSSELDLLQKLALTFRTLLTKERVITRKLIHHRFGKSRLIKRWRNFPV